MNSKYEIQKLTEQKISCLLNISECEQALQIQPECSLLKNRLKQLVDMKSLIDKDMQMVKRVKEVLDGV